MIEAPKIEEKKVGEKDLAKLIASMSPKLQDGEFVFQSKAKGVYGDDSELEPIVSVKEAEGLTLVIPKKIADKNGISYVSIFKMITLEVHSSLDAVGLTAAFASKLTEHDISANVIAGFYHDHIFVQSHLATRALDALNELKDS